MTSIDRNLDVIPDEAPDFPDWCMEMEIDGHPFQFKKREYLWKPYHDNHVWQVKLKATQVGGTVEEILRAAYGIIYRGFRHVLYYFPTASDVGHFSQSRYGPFIEENECLARHVRETNRANLRRLGDGFLHLFGMRSHMQVKSTPANLIVFDEFDEAPQLSFDKAMERLGGVMEGEGEPPEVRLISNPSLPDFGVSKLFEETDQQFWLLKCPHCNHYNDMVGSFITWVAGKGPPPLLTISGGERVIRACVKCERELDVVQGEWVAKRPSITDKRGYQYTQLWSQTIMHSPERVLAKYYRALEVGNLQDFFNLVIGIGYVEAENRLSQEEVLALCGSEWVAPLSMVPSFMGVDQGKDLHVTIGNKLPGKCAEISHIEIYKDWEELDPLMKNFNVIRCVVDALPETRNARAFSDRHPGKVWLNYYMRERKGTYAWNDKERIVSCDRTESLDASHAAIRNQKVVLPKNCKITQEFAIQLHNTAKKLEEEEEIDRKTGMKRKTGTKRYVYVRLGADHFRHSFNYFCIAWMQSLKGIFSDLDI